MQAKESNDNNTNNNSGNNNNNDKSSSSNNNSSNNNKNKNKSKIKDNVQITSYPARYQAVFIHTQCRPTLRMFVQPHRLVVQYHSTATTDEQKTDEKKEGEQVQKQQTNEQILVETIRLYSSNPTCLVTTVALKLLQLQTRFFFGRLSVVDISTADPTLFWHLYYLNNCEPFSLDIVPQILKSQLYAFLLYETYINQQQKEKQQQQQQQQQQREQQQQQQQQQREQQQPQQRVVQNQSVDDDNGSKRPRLS